MISVHTFDLRQVIWLDLSFGWCTIILGRRTKACWLWLSRRSWTWWTQSRARTKSCQTKRPLTRSASAVTTRSVKFKGLTGSHGKSEASQYCRLIAWWGVEAIPNIHRPRAPEVFHLLRRRKGCQYCKFHSKHVPRLLPTRTTGQLRKLTLKWKLMRRCGSLISLLL